MEDYTTVFADPVSIISERVLNADSEDDKLQHRFRVSHLPAVMTQITGEGWKNPHQHLLQWRIPPQAVSG
ncbi:unnamed protein product [Linum trigynum]|uniref:Uncharacterized protein n=1 Tax=Linum trigynum TaxID=586398 RepID=A0AAV2GMF5_9ROSI